MGFLLGVNAHLISTLSDVTERVRFLAATTALVLRLAHSDLASVFNHFHRTKDALYRHELSDARKHFHAHYCNRRTETQKVLTAATPLTTEDANSLYNRIAQSESSSIVLDYFDSVVGAAAVTAATSSNGSGSSGGSGESGTNSSEKKASQQKQQCRWEDTVAWDTVTDARLAEISASTSAANGSAGELQWSLLGIAMLGLTVLRALPQQQLCGAGDALLQPAPHRESGDEHSKAGQEDSPLLSAVRGLLPQVLSRSYLCAAVRPYAWTLLRSPLAAAEGLELACLVFNSHPAGTLNCRFLRPKIAPEFARLGEFLCMTVS